MTSLRGQIDPASKDYKGKNYLWKSFEAHWPFLLGLAVVAGLLLTFYDRFWMAADDGFYAHTASRVLAGEVPHRDFHEFHTGLVLWIHVAALKIFGDTLVSIRIPLLIFSFVQALLVYKIIAPHGRLYAGLAMVFVTAIGLPATPNPTANLYSLFFAIAALYVAQEKDVFFKKRYLFILGLILGLCFTVRQLSGVLLSCGFVMWLFSHPVVQNPKHVSAAGRFLVVLAFVIIAVYSIGRSDLFSFPLFALPALLIGLVAVVRARPDVVISYRIITWLGVGFLMSLVPIISFQLYAGTFSLWLNDIFILPRQFFEMPFIETHSFLMLIAAVLYSGPKLSDLTQFINMLTWVGLILLPSLFGFWSYGAFYRQAMKQGIDIINTSSLPAFVIVAPFYLLGVLHFEVAQYLLWGIPLSFFAGLYFLSTSHKKYRPIFAWVVVAVIGSIISITGHPVWRGTVEAFVLNRPEKQEMALLAGRGQIYLPSAEQEFYTRMLVMIKQQANNSKQLFSFPTHPEWYYLTGLKNPTPHIFAGITMNTEEKLKVLKQQFQASWPDVIIFKPEDKYNTQLTLELRAWLSVNYRVFHVENGFEFLKLIE